MLKIMFQNSFKMLSPNASIKLFQIPRAISKKAEARVKWKLVSSLLFELPSKITNFWVVMWSYINSTKHE
jgi:hypothetical protein